METEITFEQATEKFLESCPEGCVLQLGEYSPNGSPSTWQTYIPHDQAPDLNLDNQEDYDGFELSEDGTELKAWETPANGKHTYRSWEWVPATDYAAQILDAYTPDGTFNFGDIQKFSDWLDYEMDLEEDSEGWKACIKVALQMVIERMD